MIRITTACATLAVSLLAVTYGARAEENADSKLLIVNGNTGHVVYDDGRDDLFCVTRRVTVGYDAYGHHIRRRSMHCR